MISLTNLTMGAAAHHRMNFVATWCRQKRLLRTIGTIISATTLQCALGGWMQSANAEGSRELVKNGGNRPFTEWRTDKTAGILRRTVLKVYANANEVINLGSSAVGVDKGDILVFKDTDNVDTATPLLKCKPTGTGVLDTRDKEIAGPLPTTGGYTPCTYTAPSSGVYKVVFYGTDGKTGTNDPIKPSVSVDYITNPLITTDQRSTVSMWDITVRSSKTSTTDINGRVFTDYIALVMGDNGRYLKSNLYILTDDGYRYSTDFSVGAGLDPNGFLFFANQKGLLTPGGQPLYHSGQKKSDSAMTPPLDGGVTIQAPKYPIFFNPPSDTAVSGLSVPLTALPPSPATNFSFTGGAGGSGNQTPKSVGGTFSFNALQKGGYQIIIDANNDGKYNNTPVSVNVNGTPTLISDRILEGNVVIGSNTATWDGKDGTANPVTLEPKANNAPYNARIVLKGGEYHFPLLDAESGADGFKIQMLNPPGTFSNGASTTTIYFDERDYTVSGTTVTLGCDASVGLPVCDARGGVDSALGAHKFGNNTGSPTDYGDKKALDTWIYFPSDATFSTLVIITTTPNLRLVKRVTGIRKFGSSTTTPIPGYNDLATDINDDPSVNWVGGSSNYLLGAITTEQIPVNPGLPAPQDEVEYTIYFLSDGAIAARDVNICDFVPANQTFVPGSMQLNFNGTTTNIADGSGTGSGSGFYTSNFPASCYGTNNNKGAVSIQVGDVISVINTPSSSYGYIRFRAKVN
jgi:uncharacterized repeat protein (TIGR01451 family)